MKSATLLLGLQSVLHSVLGGEQGSTQVPFDYPTSSTSHGKRLLTDEIKQLIQNVNVKHGVPGMALAVVHAGGETEYGNWGIRTEDGDPMASDTMFTIASTSKAFLTSAMGILIDDFAHGRNTTPLPDGVRRFDWDTKVQELLPDDWKLMDRWAEEKASVKDILSHRSGMPGHDMAYSRKDTPESMVQCLRYLRPAYELRERDYYTNIMYMVGSHIISTYTGSFPDFVENRIFRPLNMTSTYSPTIALSSGKATHIWGASNGRRIPWWATEDDYTLIAGNGGVIASAEDLASWLRMLLHSGVNPSTNATILPPFAFEATTSARVVTAGRGSKDVSIRGYGMGWGRFSYQGHEIVKHTGGFFGITTIVLFAPHDGVGIAVLTNADQQDEATERVANTILRKAFGIDHDVPSERLELRPQERPSRALEDAPVAALPTYDFTGTYHDDGYGSFVICNSSSTSSYCTDVLSDFRSVEGKTELSPQTLYVAWPRLVATHLRFAYLDGMRFAMRPTALFPHGYGRDTSPFETFPINTTQIDIGFAEFVAGDAGEVVGLGLFAAEPNSRVKKGGSVYETADAWFVRTR